MRLALAGYGEAMAPPLPGITLLRAIGTGGTSTVYLGRQEDLDRLVAVKVLKGHVDDGATWRRFVREARTVARLSGHPNVVTVHTAGRTEMGEPYLVTDYLDGGSLADVVARRGPLDEATVRRVGVALADALGAAHDLGIVHRDVKPGNVLVDHAGHVKLADFGIARLADATTTLTSAVALTPEYAAPEVLGDEPEGPWTDVYGLAATLVFALTGAAPIPAREGERVEAYLVRKQQFVPRLPVEVSPALRTALGAALSPDPRARPDLPSLRRALAMRDEAATVAAPVVQPARGSYEPTVMAPAATPPDDRRRPDPLLLVLFIVCVLAFLAGGVIAAARLRSNSDHSGAPTTTAAVATTSGATVAPTSAAPPPATTAAPTTAAAPATTAKAAPTTARPAPTTAAPTTARPAPTTAAPAPTAAAAPASGDRAARADEFSRRYYSTVAARDYPTAWSLLSPEYQRSLRGGYDGYVRFWNTVDGIEVRAVDVVPGREDQYPIVARLTMRYTINGRVADELDEVQLQPSGNGDLLIANYRVVRAL
jgi:tRNA A-37 threonylcarbamoyl transferase component Bud32